MKGVNPFPPLQHEDGVCMLAGTSKGSPIEALHACLVLEGKAVLPASMRHCVHSQLFLMGDPLLHANSYLLESAVSCKHLTSEG